MSNLENRSLSDIKQIAEIGITTLISSYFFTMGYINSFALPIKIDFFQAGYFIITLFSDSILVLLFDLSLGLIDLSIKILKLPIYIFTFLKERSDFDIVIIYNLIFSNFLKNNYLLLISIYFVITIIFYIKSRYRKTFEKMLAPFIFVWKKINSLYFSFKILVYYIIYIVFCKLFFESINLKYSFFNFFYEIQKELGFCIRFAGMLEERNSCRYVSRVFYHLEWYINNIRDVFFMFSLLIAIFSVPIFIALNINKNTQFKIHSRDFLLLVLFILLSVSWSYNLGRNYLGSVIDYPIYRSSPNTIDERVQIWRDKNDYFYVECKENSSSLIKGFNTQTDEMFYLGFLDNHSHPNLCPKQKKGIITKDFDDKRPFKNCYYESSKDVVFSANNCFKVSNNVLLTPLGTVSPCYVHISKLVGVFKEKDTPFPGDLMEHYENNFEHIPINKSKGPISNISFSIGHKPQWDTRYISFKELSQPSLIKDMSERKIYNSLKESSELWYGYKIPTIFLAFVEGISKNFPKCD